VLFIKDYIIILLREGGNRMANKQPITLERASEILRNQSILEKLVEEEGTLTLKELFGLQNVISNIIERVVISE